MVKTGGGIQDKMTSIDLSSYGRKFRYKVIIPVHYDIWSNFMAPTNEILELLYRVKIACNTISM